MTLLETIHEIKFPSHKVHVCFFSTLFGKEDPEVKHYKRHSFMLRYKIEVKLFYNKCLLLLVNVCRQNRNNNTFNSGGNVL